MLEQFKSYLQTNFQLFENKNILVAASGGLDSTALIHLCQQTGLNFGICHVNFKLRGNESDIDQAFLENLAKEFNCPIYILEENAKTYAKNHKLSTQEAAREIRYRWFENCITKRNYDFLFTAHHADDNLETYLINSFRGTGIKGLTGISAQRAYIVRPLLNYTRDEILDFATKENIKWSEDKSNASDNYLRNVIRHHLVPFFKERQDNLYARFNTTRNNIDRQETLLDDYLNLVFKQVVSDHGRSYRINIKNLIQFPNHDKLLIELLKDFGFTDWDTLASIINADVGKFVTSTSHKLVKERGFLELFLKEQDKSIQQNINLNKLPRTILFKEGKLIFETDNNFDKTKSNIAFLSKDLLKNELILRPYEIGDYFCPLGMNGRKKLSDFLKDEKLSTLEKSKVWVLVHNKNIIWVINQRIDDRYKITENTEECLKVTYTN